MSEQQWREMAIADSCCGCGSVRTNLENDEAWDGDEARCDCCGRPGRVSADEDGAHVNWHDEPYCKCWWCQSQSEYETLRAEVERLTREKAELRAIVDKLPKTADGVPVVVGMRFWIKSDVVDPEPDFDGWVVTGIGPEYATEHSHYDWVRTDGIGWLTTTAIYSTEAAARAAIAATKEVPRGEA